MRKIVILVILVAYTTSYAQKTNLRATKLNDKYENVFYRSPEKYNNQEQVFKVSRIAYSSNYIGSESKNVYQISIYGTVSNNKEQIVYNAKSIDEIEYYKNLFNGRYEKILLYVHANKVQSKNYYNTSISVEY